MISKGLFPIHMNDALIYFMFQILPSSMLSNQPSVSIESLEKTLHFESVGHSRSKSMSGLIRIIYMGYL